MEHFGLGGLLFIRAAADMGTSKEANDRVSDFVRRKIRETVSTRSGREADVDALRPRLRGHGL